MTTIKSYSNISRFKSIFYKRTVLKLSKDKFCNLECLVCYKLYRKKSQCNMIYFTAHSPKIPQIMKIESHINNLTVYLMYITI